MKTKITSTLFIAVSFLFAANISKAQNWLTAGNTLTGGTSSTPNEWFGSSNLYDIIVKTNNTQRMRLLSGGHILIGTGTAATYPLTLNDYTNAGTLSSGGNFAVSFHSIVGGVAIGGQDINNNAAFGTTGSTSDILFATYNGTSFDERLRIKSGGNVGIGTTSPAALLDVKGFVRSLAVTTLVAPTTGKGVELVYRADGGNDFGLIQTYDRGGSGAYKQMRLDASSFAFSFGNVGIGTTSPRQKVEVIGTVYVNNEGSGVIVDAAGQSRVGLMKYFGTEAAFTHGNTVPLRWGQVNQASVIGGTFTEQMRIDNNGNLAIGTTTATHKLEVFGTSRFWGEQTV
ncbi:MAG: hypothetical protein K8R85_01740, partial [Bacteroidetes bacterium]|nr:hypothetical protein [Bacteroidota bacterium]